jgi:hypothetical protein
VFCNLVGLSWLGDLERSQEKIEVGMHIVDRGAICPPCAGRLAVILDQSTEVEQSKQFLALAHV